MNRGYTNCCNQCRCTGSAVHFFGTRERHVTACCFSKASEAGIEFGCQADTVTDLYTDAQLAQIKGN